MQLGLTPPPQYTAPAASVLGIAAPQQPAPAPQQINIGGVLSMKGLSATLAQDQAAAATYQTTPVVENLASYVRRHWTIAREAKQDVERKMLNAVRARRGEYPPEKLAEIKASGGSEIFMLLFATKARQAKALLTDALIGAGTEKPWTLSPTPRPDLPPETVNQIMQAVMELVAEYEMTAQPASMAEVRELLQDAKDRAESELMEMARREAARAEIEIEDILVEGGWLEALDEFLDDLTTFKTAFLKGPITRTVPQLEWAEGPGGVSVPVVKHARRMEWERRSAFDIYPAPWAKGVNDAFLFDRHQLSRGELHSLIGVDGYNESAIRRVLDLHGTAGFHQWLTIDVERPQAEGRELGGMAANRSDLIDALQYWGSVSGKLLREWGMKAAEVPDEAKEYQVEAWIIGDCVIKAVINPDPLGRRPYYADGYARVPGAFWHNSLYDLIEDDCDMCNAAARALANNMGLASGPMVDVNVERLAQGEKVTSVYPWKIVQTVSDPMGSTAKAVNFFQPTSNAQELMAVFEKFAALADEHSGIPRYMAGVEGASGGAGRTASGLSMMIGNAGKTTQTLIGSLDMRVIGPSVGRVYEKKIQTDASFRGDLKVVARGARSLGTREALHLRRNEFLQFTNNPVDLQIMGVDGRAELLRESAKGLQMNTDKVVPSASTLRMRMAAEQMAMAQQPQAQPGQQPQLPAPGGEQLMNGAPVTDNFSPT